MFLTRAELHELSGFKIPSKQIEWLTAEGFLYRVAADGYPRVLRSAVNELMGGKTAQDAQEVIQSKPQFGEFI